MLRRGLRLLAPRGALILPIGAPASGKSTFAAALAHVGIVAPEDVLVADRLRAQLTGDPRDTSADRRVWPLLRLHLVERMAQGRTAVVDATNLHAPRRGRHVRVARAHGRPVVAVVLDVPVEELRARNERRRRVVPDGALLTMAAEAAAIDREQLLAEGVDVVMELEDVLAAQPAIRLASAAISSMPPSTTTDVPVM